MNEHSSKKLSLQQAQESLQELSSTLQGLRKQNNGLLPVGIWESLFRITNICPTFEVVVAVYSEMGEFLGWALKKRESDDFNWPDLFHAPGTVLRHHDTPASIRERLDIEIFGKPTTYQFQELPCVVRLDPIRDATCLSIVYLLSIAEDQTRDLPGVWRVFTHSEILAADPRTIVDQIPLYTRAFGYFQRHPQGD